MLANDRTNDAQKAIKEIEAAAFPRNAENQSEHGADRDLAEAARDGDAAAFEHLHSLFRSRVFGFAFNRLRDRSEADDICQEVFLEVHRSIGRYEGRSPLAAWILGIARHKVCDRLRNRPPASLSLDDTGARNLASDQPLPDRAVDASRRYATCARLVSERIHGANRRIFELRHVRGHSTRKIAAELGKTPGAVKKSILRTRHELARMTSHCGSTMDA